MFYQFKFAAAFVYVLFFTVLSGTAKDTLTVSSPSERIRVAVWLDKDIKYEVRFDGKIIVAPSDINMIASSGKPFFSELSKIKSAKLSEHHDTIVSPVGEKRKNIKDHYRLLNIQMKDPYALQVRVYDDGFAYRVITALSDSVIIQNEITEINFP
ncbi:MAG: hypothetical protein RL642_1079, partial [Bacteroidota bacterium]